MQKDVLLAQNKRVKGLYLGATMCKAVRLTVSLFVPPSANFACCTAVSPVRINKPYMSDPTSLY